MWMADIQLLGRRDPSDPDTVTAYYFQNWHTNYTIVEGTTTTVLMSITASTVLGGHWFRRIVFRGFFSVGAISEMTRTLCT